MNDPVERDDVIDAICNKCMLDHKMERRMPTLCRNCRTVKMIQAIPSAEVPTTMTEVIDAIREAEYRGYMKAVEDRPKGEWIDAEIPLECGGSMPIQVCNLCKTFYPLAYTGGGHRFCPNCGTRMKGADDD